MQTANAPRGDNLGDKRDNRGDESDNQSGHARTGISTAVPNENFILPITLISNAQKYLRRGSGNSLSHNPTGTNRQPVFFTVADRKLYLQLIRENLNDAGVRVLAYCLMTNHVHFIAVPEREETRGQIG